MSYNLKKTKINSSYLKCIKNNCKTDMNKLALYNKELKRYLKNLYKKKDNIESIIIHKVSNDKYLKKLSKKLDKCSDRNCIKEKRIVIENIVKDINRRIKSKRANRLKSKSKSKLTKRKNNSISIKRINNIKKQFNIYEKELNELDKQIGETKHVLHNLKKSLKRTLKEISS